MDNKYPEKDVIMKLLSAILPYLSGADQAIAVAGLPATLTTLLSELDLDSSMSPGNHFLNQMDQSFQNVGMQSVGVASLMASDSFMESNSLFGILRKAAGGYVSGHEAFMKSYQRALGSAGAFSPVDRMYGGNGYPTESSLLPGLPYEHGSFDRERAENARTNVSALYTKLAESYGKDKTGYGGANLGDIGQVAAEVVRTGGLDFGATKKTFDSKLDKLDDNIKGFTKTTMRLKDILGGSALHALSVMSDAFGSNVVNTFRGSTSLLDRQVASITHTARLTGTSVSTIVRMGGVAGGLIRKMGGDDFAAPLAGVMGAQYGQFGGQHGSRFVDESSFRAMQLQRVTGAVSSRTARNISGAYAIWKLSKDVRDKNYKTEEESQTAFNEALKKAAGGEVTKMGDVEVLKKMVHVENEADLKNAGRLDSARLYKGTNQLPGIVAKARQMDYTRKEREFHISNLVFNKTGERMSKADLDRYDIADETERKKILDSYAAMNENVSEDNMNAVQADIKRALDTQAKARGYRDDNYYRDAARADERAKTTRANVARRTKLSQTLGINDVTGPRAILEMFDRIANADENDVNLPTMREFVARSIGLRGDKETLQKFNIDTKLMTHIPQMFEKLKREGYKNMTKKGVESHVMEMVRTLDSDALSEKESAKLSEDMKIFMTVDKKHGEKDRARAYEDAMRIGTKSGYMASLKKKYGSDIEASIPKSSVINRLALLDALDKDKNLGEKEKAELRTSITERGSADKSVVKLMNENTFRHSYVTASERMGGNTNTGLMQQLMSALLPALARWKSLMDAEHPKTASANTPSTKDNSKKPASTGGD